MRSLNRRLLKRRPILLVVALFLLALSPAYAPTAKSSNGCLWYQAYNYYSDATYTTHVGYKGYFCDGEIGYAGTQTPYYTIRYCECEEVSK
jgi:hypothetical protein